MSSLYEFDDTGNTPTNVADEFVGMTTEEIRRKIEDAAGESVTICMNLTSDFNKSAILRTHTALGGSDFYIVGKRRFDRRGSVGTHHYAPVHHALTLRPVDVELLHDDAVHIHIHEVVASPAHEDVGVRFQGLSVFADGNILRDRERHRKVRSSGDNGWDVSQHRDIPNVRVP